MFVSPLLLSLLCLHLAESSPLKRPFSREIEINNNLALNLLPSLSNEDNTFFSPLSLFTTFLVLLNGADGDTDKDLRRVLDLEEKEDLNSINAGMKSFLESLDEKHSKEMNVKLLTRLLVAKKSDKTLKETFVKIVKESLKSDVQEVDFKDNAKQVTKDLNQWVEEETDSKIKGIFKDDLDPQSSLVLANAVYFAGEWRRPFDGVGKMDFHNLHSFGMAGIVTSIAFMSLTDELRSKSSPELKSTLVEVPYSHDLSMIIVLPNSQDDLEFLNENITSGQLTTAIEELMAVKASPLRVTMPKFKMEHDYDLKEPLEDMFEVKTLFPSPNLSKALKDGQGGLKMSQMVHLAYIDVNEEGADAADVTNLSPPSELVIDRPFLFMIRDQSYGLICFMGRVQTLVDQKFLTSSFI